MKKNKIGFIILHYIVKDETIKCVDSILNKIDNSNYEIIIVDNASLNDSGKQLQELYCHNEKIHIILNEKNLGFTGGNNIGFKFAKKLKCDFICMMNNDTYLIQDDFFKVIKEEYDNSHFAVMGPEIHLKNNAIELVNKKLISKDEVKKQIKRCKKLLIMNYLYLESLELLLKKIIKKVIKYKTIDYRVNNPIEKRCEDVILHGCCLVFSPIYISKFDGLNQKTFLYKEEELLYVRLKQNDMLSVYNPKLKIFHSEDKATNSVTKRDYRKRRFIYKYNIKACYALIEEMEKVL